MKKSISFTLFGTDLKYYAGAKKNIEINKKLLPEWNNVIYYHPEMTNMGFIEQITEEEVTLKDVSDIIIGGKNSKEFPFFWRFLIFLEDSISIVRDLDSRNSDREVFYIKKWIESQKDYFIIRDHPWHSPVPSGLFGIKNRKKSFEEYFNFFVSNYELKWGADQEMLQMYMEKVEKENIEYFGFDKKDTYIPRDDENFFIGIQLDENDKPTIPSGVACLNYLKEINL